MTGVQTCALPIYKSMDLIAMLQAAKSEGLNPLICSSYRTNEKQEQLYQNKVSEYLTTLLADLFWLVLTLLAAIS